MDNFLHGLKIHGWVRTSGALLTALGIMLSVILVWARAKGIAWDFPARHIVVPMWSFPKLVIALLLVALGVCMFAFGKGTPR